MEVPGGLRRSRGPLGAVVLRAPPSWRSLSAAPRGAARQPSWGGGAKRSVPGGARGCRGPALGFTSSVSLICIWNQNRGNSDKRRPELPRECSGWPGGALGMVLQMISLTYSCLTDTQKGFLLHTAEKLIYTAHVAAASGVLFSSLSAISKTNSLDALEPELKI